MMFSCYVLKPKLETLIKRKENFIIRTTNSSLIIKHNNNQYIQTMPFMKLRHLHLFQAVKKEIKTNYELNNFDFQPVKYNEIPYFLFNPHFMGKGEVINNIVEFDISKAYLTTALNMNLISPEFFKKICDLPKQIRLIILGSIASTAIITTYENGQIKGAETKRDEFFITIWKHICLETGKKMIELTALDSFLFFWVDGAFFDLNKNTLQEIEEKINSIKDYEFKKVDCESIVRISNYCIVKKSNGIEKQFFIVSNKNTNFAKC